jgi:phage shock protein A
MSGQPNRFRRLLRNWAGSLAAPAEDPRRAYAYTQQRQLDLLEKIQRALAELDQSRSQLEGRAEEAATRATALEDRARHHLAAGREDLARSVLGRWAQVMAEARGLAEQIGEMRREVQRLALLQQRLRGGIEAFHAQQELIAARYCAAETQVRISTALSGVSGELADLGAALDAAAQRSEAMQARAAAIRELVESGALNAPGAGDGDPLAGQLTHLGAARDIEEALIRLKRQIDEDGLADQK